jgi:hypothetical protein
MSTDFQIPSQLDTRTTFLRTLDFVIESGYRRDMEASKADYDAGLSNAIDETAFVLGIRCPDEHPNPVEWYGELTDWAAEAGYVWIRG